MSRVLSMSCPHCRHRATVRTSSELSPMFREATFACRNNDCGHVFVVGLEVLRTLSPSAIPDPRVRIPMSPHVRQRALALQFAPALETPDV